jgi:ABC-type glycerol-3-phosphate transport system substrate-binding protein
MPKQKYWYVPMKKNRFTGIRGRLFCGLPAIVAAFLFASCDHWEPAAAVLWTDRPEFAVYAGYFNSSQDKFKIETRYSASIAQGLTGAKDCPDIVIGSWLKSASTRSFFKPLDYFFKKGINSDTFYSQLLSLGKIDGKQYLLPVSFNIPALAFSKSNSQMFSNPFTITGKEIMEAAKSYNRESNGVFTQMGFSPSWDDEFIFVTATLFNAGFREAKPLEWDQAALEESLQYIRDWIAWSNTNTAMEDDFFFKYFFVPQTRLAVSGRILFCYLESSDFFTLDSGQQDSLDFRWIAGEDGTIPLVENTTYYGISRNSRAKKAADAFTLWFFREDTQRLLLEESKRRGMNEILFGIGGGFSAMRSATEHIFPRYYPGLLGHMPPDAALTPPNILPHNWMTLKREVILPYLRSRIRGENNGGLDRRLAEWLRISRNP